MLTFANKHWNHTHEFRNYSEQYQRWEWGGDSKRTWTQELFRCVWDKSISTFCIKEQNVGGGKYLKPEHLLRQSTGNGPNGAAQTPLLATNNERGLWDREAPETHTYKLSTNIRLNWGSEKRMWIYWYTFHTVFWTIHELDNGLQNKEY